MGGEYPQSRCRPWPLGRGSRLLLLLTCGLTLDIETWEGMSGSAQGQTGRVGGTEPLIFLGSQTQTSGGEDGFPDMALASCPALAVPYPQPLTNIPRGLERRMAGLRRCRVSVDVR